MPRLLLTTVLALTQLISWSSAPLYLCLGCDGSVALDFGPSGCHHCKHKSGQLKQSAAVCCRHSTECRHHLAAARTTQRSAIVHACGCRHIQLSQPNVPVVVRAQRTSDHHRSLASLEAAVSTHPIDALANCAAGLQRHSPDTFSLPSPTTLISSVVLRC